jgi:hypothetical protein
MAVIVVDVVGVVSMGNGLMTAPLPVNMIVVLVRNVDDIGTLIPVTVVEGVSVPIMEVVGVVTMGDSDMATALAVSVGVIVVSGVGVGHGALLVQRARYRQRWASTSANLVL